jgi:cytochrome c2
MMRLSRSFRSKIFISLSALMLLTFNAFAGIFEGGDAAKGESLFKANCASCHKVTAEVLAAPGLEGLEGRWKGKDALLVKWIQNPQGAAATGDPYIKSLVDKWMPNFGWMANQAVSEAEIKDILAYVKTPPVAAGGAAVATTNKCMTLEDIKKEKEKNEESDGAIWFIIIGAILAIIAVTASNISRSLKNAINEREGLAPLPDIGYWQASKAWMWTNRKFVSVIGLFLFCYFAVVGYSTLMDIGVYDGYTPEQPIWFSHAIHNCQNEIDC